MKSPQLIAAAVLTGYWPLPYGIATLIEGEGVIIGFIRLTEKTRGQPNNAWREKMNLIRMNLLRIYKMYRRRDAL